VLVGTEAVLRRVERAAPVAFLDLDAELLAPRYRAAEEAMALVARAARLLGGKAAGGRLLLQTKLPRHEVVQAALLADPGRVADAELERRRALLLPPVTALAHVAGAGAEVFARAAAEHPGVTALGPAGRGLAPPGGRPRRPLRRAGRHPEARRPAPGGGRPSQGLRLSPRR
jgi:primosomal protein N' (replication factor Y)